MPEKETHLKINNKKNEPTVEVIFIGHKAYVVSLTSKMTDFLLPFMFWDIKY